MLRIPRKKKKEFKKYLRTKLGYVVKFEKSSIQKDENNVWSCINYPKVPWKK